MLAYSFFTLLSSNPPISPTNFFPPNTVMNPSLPQGPRVYRFSRIDDRKSPHPRMRGFLHGSSIIARERGIRGFFQGFVPTTARQAANSATRFGSYTTLKQFAESYVAPGERLGTLSTFALGGVAGLITVYVTQPLDTVKTRMQSIEARTEYRNTFVCAGRMLREEGVRIFWSGALPRLVRLVLSGGIVFTM